MQYQRRSYQSQGNRNHGQGARREGGFRPRNNYQSRGRRTIKTLDPRFFVQRAIEQVQEVYIPTHSFHDFDFIGRLKQNITSRGYESPTPIQDQTIPALMEGKDVVGIAATGTGKTAAFLLPLIHKVAKDSNQRVLIVAPTRELAVQIQDEFKLFAEGMNLYSVLCIGGVSMGPQVYGLSRRPQFVIGTPGRLQDLERQRKLSFNWYNNIVLDEVDRMLDMGFVHEVTHIISKLPTERQSLFFSATMPDSVQRVMQGFLNNPVMVSVKSVAPSANVDQDIIETNGKPKIDVLHELLGKDEFKKVLVFGRTKWGMEKLSKALSERGVRTASIHGNKNQNQRQKAIEMFKNNRVQVLLATDIASRGLDIDNVTHVINFDQPESYEDYIHRIGRTGRAGKKGIALTFIE
jgi:ATP-dependent RNA helicase RhlE